MKKMLIVIMILMISKLYAFEVTGVVTDEKGEVLIGANVLIEHTSMGSVTDPAGKFLIKGVKPGHYHVVATMVGYRPRTINVDVTKNVGGLKFHLEETSFQVGAVVVTGTSTPHIFEDMPVKTELISRPMIEKKQAINLAEALTCQTGIWVENNCNNCNFTQVRINGLDGKYSQILVDGDPVISSLAGVYGLEQIPEEMIEQIEIVKGGGSSLYGGNAIAGVINLKTRDPLVNKLSFSYHQQLTGSENVDHKLTFSAEVADPKKKSSAFVFGSARHRSPYDYNDDGYSELGKLKSSSIGANWYYHPLDAGRFLLSVHYIHEERRGGNDFSHEPHEADIAEWLEHWRWGGKAKWEHQLDSYINYSLTYSFALTHRKSYYGGLSGPSFEERVEALKFYGRSDNPLQIASAQVNLDKNNHLLTFGTQYSYEELNDKTSFNQTYHIDENFDNIGLFLQDNLHFLDNHLEMVAGLRMDKHSELDDPVYSPRLNLKYSVNHSVVFRGAFTTGFKAPQIFDEDLHIGALEGDQKLIRNSSDLDAEKSYSVTAGFDLKGEDAAVPYLAAVSFYHTRLNDAFQERFVKKENETALWERYNGDGADVTGLDFDLSLRPVRPLEARLGLSYKKAEYDEKHEDFDTKEFFRTPDWSSHGEFLINLSEFLDFNVLATYMGTAKVPHEKADPAGGEEPILILEESGSYWIVDLGFRYRLKNEFMGQFEFSAGVKNVFDAYQDDLDRGADRDPAYVYGPSLPRTLYFKIKATL